MNIKEQITEWQGAYLDRCCSSKEEAEANANLELVLFAIDTLVNKVEEPSTHTFKGGNWDYIPNYKFKR